MVVIFWDKFCRSKVVTSYIQNCDIFFYIMNLDNNEESHLFLRKYHRFFLYFEEEGVQYILLGVGVSLFMHRILLKDLEE